MKPSDSPGGASSSPSSTSGPDAPSTPAKGPRYRMILLPKNPTEEEIETFLAFLGRRDVPALSSVDLTPTSPEAAPASSSPSATAGD